jgi:hypothetical protein
VSGPRRWWLVGSSIALAASTAIAAFGGTPWPIVFVAIGLGTIVVGQLSSWPFAFASAAIGIVFVFSLLIRVTPWLGISLGAAALLTLVVLSLAALAAMAFTPEVRLPTTRNLTLVAPALAVAAAAGVAGLALVGAGNVAWAMNNDAAWNLMSTRLIVDDGGLRPDQHPNASPLTASLLAITISAGREGVAPGALLQHDVTRAAELWIVLVAISVALAALIGLRSTHGAPMWLRAVAAVVTGLLPLSWYMFGWAAFFGFYNATLALVVLLASWLAWLETRVAPILGSATLSIATVALLAIWAPLAAVPAGLAIVALLSRVGALARARGRQTIWWALAALPVPIYVAFVTLPDLGRDGGALVADGGILALSPGELLATVAAVSVVVIGFALVSRSFHLLVGYIVVVLASGLGVAYLVMQRLQSDVPAWGYYPIKMAWMASSLMLVILVATVFAALALLKPRLRAVLTAAIVGVALLGGILAPNPPIARPVTVNAIIPTNPFVEPLTAKQEAARIAFTFAQPGERTLVARYSADPVVDRDANYWLLQLGSTAGNEPIRTFAYYLDPEDPAVICAAVETWGGEVSIHTSDPGLEDSLRETCPDADFEVTVHGD